MTTYEIPADGEPLQVVAQKAGEEITISIDGLEIGVWRSMLESDAGQPVIQIDGSGMFRVNVNDYPIWNADPDKHQHEHCQCVHKFEEGSDR